MTSQRTDWTRAINNFLSDMQKVIDVLAPKVEPVVRGVLELAQETQLATDMRGSGWLPHHTTPRQLVAECRGDMESIQKELEEFYERNWPSVRCAIEAQMSGHDIDEEAKAAFGEALDAHGHGLYRCVPRTLYPEIDRLLRIHVMGTKTGSGIRNDRLRELVENEDTGLSDFLPGGWVHLDSFLRLAAGIRKPDKTWYDDSVFGIFRWVTDDDVERVESDPVPNRHAVAHALVPYPYARNSLNAIFFVDYIFQLIGSWNDDQPAGA